MIYFILESTQLNELRWNGTSQKYISTSYLKHYLYNIMKIKCSFTILLMVKKNLYKTKMVRTHDMRRNYWDYKYLFRYAVRYRYWTKKLYKSISTFISNETLSHSMWLIPPYSPIYFLPLKKLKSTRLSVGLFVSLPQILSACLFVFTIYNSQIITH